MERFLTKCPKCGNRLKIVEYRCSKCEIRIGGDFEGCEFCGLGSEELDFLRVFLKTRGNLSEVAKIFSVSYPTIRLRFENFLKKLGMEPIEVESDISEILNSLEKEEITAQEAEKQIRRLKGG